MEFPGVKALQNVDFEVETGEIRAVVGANGAGKSTLMKVLAGANPGYTGEIFIDGKPVEIRTPAQAKELGIEIVYQEVDTALIPTLSVAENIMMNYLISGMEKKVIVDWPKLKQEARESLSRLGLDIDVDTRVNQLPLAQKQMVLIARAVREHCNFLLLDEPTAPLSLSETQTLFEMIRRLMENEQICIIFISHRLQEITEICETLTVMRNGKIVDNRPITPEVTIQQIVETMLGRKYDDVFEHADHEVGEELFRVEDLSDTENKVHNVSFHIGKGEIVGIAGLVGAGKSELCKLLFGATKRSSGKIFYHGQELKIVNTTDAVKNGFSLVPEERRKEGVLVNETVEFNIVSACLGRLSTKLGFLRPKEQNRVALKYIELLGVKTPSEKQLVANLSGGNQQKVAVAKWLAAESDVYIFDEPTKGIDVGAKGEIFALIQKIASEGKCVIYVSCETQEILSITDRTYVMYSGRIQKELVTSRTNEEEITYYATGGTD
ncbi:MAG: sugar ABC transporter ATP-binding protein [Oscillospiraceae bacterium]|nr:sugar ABC transporter ATP-binding protein [Oscillospiraceae bacterium]